MVRILCSLLALPLLLSSPVAAESTVRLAKLDDGRFVAVKPLDDPANPYAQHYDELDRWVYAHWVTAEPSETELRGRSPEGWRAQFGSTDLKGYLLPRGLRRYRDGEEPLSLRDALAMDEGVYEPGTRARFFASGPFPAELAALEEAARLRATALKLPPIPAWLGNQPPLLTIFSPDGDIFTYGELGLQLSKTGSDWPAFFPPLGERWYRYSTDGQLKRTYDWEPYVRLHMFYEPELDRIAAERFRPPDVSRHFISLKWGYFVQMAGPPPGAEPPYSNGAPLGALDYDGSPVDLDAPVPPERQRYGATTNAEEVARAYAAQVQLGLTDPAAVSPYAGRPAGPQVADPTPRAPRAWAGTHYGTRRQVPVLPLEDPANPYRAQYEAWDRWAFGQLRQENPVEEAYLKAAFDQARAQSGAAGVMRGVAAYVPALDDPWFKVTFEATPEGYLIPLRQSWEAEARRLQLHDARDGWPERGDPFTVPAGGVPDPALREQYEAAYWAAMLPLYPRIPDWVRPAHRIVILPDGGVLSYGPLGGAPADVGRDDWHNRPELWEGVQPGWHRYDAEGRLVAAPASDSWDFTALLDPMQGVRQSAYRGMGTRTVEYAGYQVFFKNGAPYAAFDWDGTPVDAGGPLRREPHYLLQDLDWRTVLRAKEAQAKYGGR